MSDAEKSQQLSEEIAKRPNYFAGQYLLEEDFKSEQNYHIERQRHHNRLLHVSGIAKGLTVSNNQGLTVKVAAGTAFDSQGRQIILLYEKAVDLVEANNKNLISDGEYTLSIRYSEELTDKQGDDDFTTTRVQEKPEFVLSSSSAKPDDTILLAKLTIKDKKVTIDQNVREYSGINLPTEEGKGVTLRAHVGVPNQAILEGSLSISGGLTVLGETHIKGSLKVQGDLHIVQSLQIGEAPESQSVNRIVNEIREGTKDKADEKALITVKAAVDLADTKANKNGNSNEDFTAAHLRVNTLTINQKDVTAICDEINEEEEKENETAIPTIAAILKYMESRMRPAVVTGVQMTYTREKREEEKIDVTWAELKSQNIEVNIPILLRERIKIIPTGREMSDLTLLCCEEGMKAKVEIMKLADCWECKVNAKEIEKEKDQPRGEEVKSRMKTLIKERECFKEEERAWWEEEAGKWDEEWKEARVVYTENEGWKSERRITAIDVILERIIASWSKLENMKEGEKSWEVTLVSTIYDCLEKGISWGVEISEEGDEKREKTWSAEVLISREEQAEIRDQISRYDKEKKRKSMRQKVWRARIEETKRS
jgi:hypothetical protein